MIKIVSGGQTGVDRAALDAAVDSELLIGGWCPKGRIAEDGVIDIKYPLQETATSLYQERTRKNVEDSDATLIINEGRLSGGTALTVKFARAADKPVLIVRPLPAFYHDIENWLDEFQVEVLNIAGPRGSTNPEIYAKTYEFLKLLFSRLR
ncbi:putative molybdenum carrier protein [Lentisphaerota bacterium ZTH]|nr:putative molybdenum carrier protein [Lentisphaerota bacterium]WET05796.1 putative molybdenum carrier protein [Lentisphaerota bacterium ZTH]